MKDFDPKVTGNLATAVKDAAVWQSFKNGEEQALTYIYNQNFDSLYTYGLKLASEPEIVKDAIQNLFLQLWHTRQNLSDISFIKPYLLRALRNHIFISIKQSKEHDDVKLALPEPDNVIFPEEEILVEQQIAQKQSQSITAILPKLTKRQREAINLKFYEGLSYEQVAEIMDLNIQSVRNLLYQALKILKEYLLSCLILSWFLG